jgi:hypothetical protein
MGWKLTLALIVLSATVVSAFITREEPENEAAARDEAAHQLKTLREYLLKR